MTTRHRRPPIDHARGLRALRARSGPRTAGALAALAVLGLTLAPGVDGKRGATCNGKRVTITENRRGKPIGPGRDVIFGTGRRDVINARGGNDRVYGAGGNDLICGGRGEDRLEGEGGRDKVLGGPGDDRGGESGPRVIGGPGDDVLEGGTGDDLLRGNDDDDVMLGQRGDDGLDGGAGSDLSRRKGFNRAQECERETGIDGFLDIDG